ncbi:electron transfer flavoprotein subunit alpha/FixB family protein, partial [bacterium]|nr:electron transfer flavoprotein subunit alpha/FixB family protein [bacterium]
ENINSDNIKRSVEIIDIIKKEKSSDDINNADIIVAGGKGACSEKGFNLIKELAVKLKASVAGSREAYEKGFISKEQQVGQTGKTVAPKLYIAVGISGANQHLVGIKNSEKIIAINNDKNAPIFENADIGIVGDLYEILEKLIKQ